MKKYFEQTQAFNFFKAFNFELTVGEFSMEVVALFGLFESQMDEVYHDMSSASDHSK